MGSDTGSSSSAELAAALHRLRSTLARARAELELASTDAAAAPIDVVVGDLREALDLLGAVESAALGVVRVLVVDDDERLGELTARGLRRLGFDAEAAMRPRESRAGEVVVFDLSVLPALSESERVSLKAARPIVLTGAVDAASRSAAADLDASDYLVKPIEAEELGAAINRRRAGESP